MDGINSMFGKSYKHLFKFYFHTVSKWIFLFQKSPENFFLDFRSTQSQSFVIKLSKNGQIKIYDSLHRAHFILTVDLKWNRIGIDAFYLNQEDYLFLDDCTSKWFQSKSYGTGRKRYRAFKCEGNIIAIPNLNDLLEIGMHKKSNSGYIVFRGQNDLYPLSSSNPILKKIFKNKIPSLIPSAYRTSEVKDFNIELYGDYEADPEFYHEVIQGLGLVHSNDLIDFDGVIDSIMEKIQENAEVCYYEVEELVEEFKFVFAQQYLSHSNCLDVTSNIEVALFFALSKTVFIDGKLDFIASGKSGFIFEIEDYSNVELNLVLSANVEDLTGTVDIEVIKDGPCILYGPSNFVDLDITININSSRIDSQSASGFMINDYSNRNQVLSQVKNIYQVEPSILENINNFIDRKKRELFPERFDDEMFDTLLRHPANKSSINIFRLKFHKY